MTNLFARLGMIALVGLAALGEARSEPAPVPFPTGTWQTEDGRARVRTERCGAYGDHLCGTVVWLQKPLGEDGKPRVDELNPDLGKRERPVLGHQMLLGLRPNPKSRYEGQVYSADNGKSYDVAVWSDDPSVLMLKGCMLIFCGTQTWKRAGDNLPGQLQGATNLANGPRMDPEWPPFPTSTGSIPARKAPPTGK